jgi:hypothetical protein
MGASAPIFKGNIMPSNTKATGVAYLDPEFSTMYATEEIGYAAAAQGTVTQATNKGTAVTLNKSAGKITMNAASLGAGASVTFTLNNSAISANDVVIVNVSGGGTAGAYWPYVSSMAAGSAVIGLWNSTGGALAEAVVLNFAIIHGAT